MRGFFDSVGWAIVGAIFLSLMVGDLVMLAVLVVFGSR